MLKVLDKAFFQIVHWEINKIVTYKDLNFGKLVCFLCMFNISQPTESQDKKEIYKPSHDGKASLVKYDNPKRRANH